MKSTKKSSVTLKQEPVQSNSMKNEKLMQAKVKLEEKLGQKMFKEVYDYLTYHDKMNTSQQKVHKFLKENYPKQVHSSIFDIEQYIFMESQAR